METISYEEFKKIDLRVARVMRAESVEGSEKLVKLSVDVGELGERQIVAGIRTAYAPEVLVGKEIVIVANLAPRTLMGLESQGMLLAASEEDGQPVLLGVERNIRPGSGIK